MKGVVEGGVIKAESKVFGVSEAVQTVDLEERSLENAHSNVLAKKRLQELTQKILDNYGQEKLDELYEKVDEFQSNLAGNGFCASSFNRQFGLCAENEKKSLNKDFGMLVFLCFLEETYNDIATIFSDRPSSEQMLKDYSAAIAYSYYSLDHQGQELIGQLYPGCLSDAGLEE